MNNRRTIPARLESYRHGSVVTAMDVHQWSTVHSHTQFTGGITSSIHFAHGQCLAMTDMDVTQPAKVQVQNLSDGDADLSSNQN